MPNVLIVGAGAVGQAYGFHLHLGGARVTFFVKAKYVADLKAGPLTLHRLHLFARAERREWREYGVISTEAEVRAGAYDTVIFTAPQDALRADDFAKRFVAWAGDDATIVCTSSGFGDYELFRDEIQVPPARLVYNIISSINFQAPIPNERFHPIPPAPGANKVIGYLAPSPLPWEGADERVRPIVDALNKGGLQASIGKRLKADFGVLEASFHPLLLGLELSGWSFAALRSSPLLPLAHKAGREAMAVAAHSAGSQPSALASWLIGPWTIGFALWAAPALMPFDFERYMQYHFTKVGVQIRMVAKNVAVAGKAAGLPIGNIEALVEEHLKGTAATEAASAQ